MNEKERWRKTDHARERKDERSGRKIEKKKVKSKRKANAKREREHGNDEDREKERKMKRARKTGWREKEKGSQQEK